MRVDEVCQRLGVSGFRSHPSQVSLPVSRPRVSTAEQSLTLQLDALRAVGCENYASGAKADCSGLTKVLGHICSSETLAVWKFDRLGRSMAQLIETVRRLEMHGMPGRCNRPTCIGQQKARL